MRFSWESFERVPVVAILRGLAPGRLEPLLAAVRAGGLTTLEITMNSPGAADQIRSAVRRGGLNIGAGTVTRVALLEEALGAGATFIVTPNLNRHVVRECVGRGIPVFPGALSPSEVATAMEWGAAMVKVFPAEVWGPAHVERLKEAVPEARLLPTGGVDLATLPAFRAAGADGFGVGSPLFDKGRIDAGDWGWLEARCRAFAAAAGMAGVG